MFPPPLTNSPLCCFFSPSPPSGYGFYNVCRIIAKLTAEKDSAYDHANDIVDLEKYWNMFTEKDWQNLLVTCTFYANNTVNECKPVAEYSIDFMQQLNHFYALAIWIVTSFFFLISMNFFPRHYPLLGWWFCITSSLAAVTFALFPCAPPRLVTELHIVDALKEFSGINMYGADPEKAVSKNPYAAFPSMHTGWSTICSLGTTYVMYKERAEGCKGWLQVSAIFLLTVWYPLLTIFTIIVTGNHFWLDAIGGLVYVLIGFLLSQAYFVNFGRMIRMEKIVYGEEAVRATTEGKSMKEPRVRGGVEGDIEGDTTVEEYEV